MIKKILMKQDIWKDAFFYGASILCAMLFTRIYLRITWGAGVGRHLLSELTSFTHDSPHQYRILIPFLARVIKTVIPVDLIYIYAFLTTIFTFLLLISYREYLFCFFPRDIAYNYSFLLLYPLFWNYCALNQIYLPSDIPAILFFVLGLIFIFKENWRLYYLFYLISTLNRDTSLFLIFAFLFTKFAKLKKKELFFHASFQLMIWVSIKYLLAKLFIRGVTPVSYQLKENITYLLSLLKFNSFTFSALLSFGFSFGLIWLLIPFSWKTQPDYFKKLLFVLIPFYCFVFLFGTLGEVRIYNELIPILLAPATYSIYNLLSFRLGKEEGAKKA